jgi:hypothetical protein
VKRLSALLLAVLLAGCAGSGRPPPETADGPIALPEIEIDHDHKDPNSHQAAHGLELAGFVDAQEILKSEPARLTDIQFFENISVVTVNGRTAGSSGGFLVFDLATPTQPELLARYRSGSEDNWYTKISPDGRYVFLTANGATNVQPALEGVRQSVEDGAPTMAARGIQVVDIGDPRAPKLVGYFPAPVRVINLAPWRGPDGATYVAASMTNDRVSRVTNTVAARDLNYVSILRFDPTLQRLEEVARWQPTDLGSVTDAFPHDLSVVFHPLHARPLLYVAYWDAGAYIVDLANPQQPKQAARIPSLGLGDHVHTFKPHPGLIGDKVYAVLAPETFGGEHSGRHRLIDVTNAREPRVIAQWQLPPGIEANPENLIFSPHEFSLANDRLYASHFHGGAWVLKIPSFEPIATWQTSVGEPARTGDWAVDIETAVKYGGYVWAVDMGSGVLILRETV